MVWILFFSLWIFAGICIGQLINIVDRERGQYTIDNRWMMSVGWVYVHVMAILEWIGTKQSQPTLENQGQSIDSIGTNPKLGDDEWIKQYIEPLVQPVPSVYDEWIKQYVEPLVQPAHSVHGALLTPDFIKHLRQPIELDDDVEDDSEYNFVKHLQQLVEIEDGSELPDCEDGFCPFHIGDVANLSGQ